MSALWVSPLVLWLVFAASLPSLAIERHKAFSCWINGVLFASAVFTTFIVVVG